MKRWSILLVMILFCSVYGHAQFWINFGWNEPYCENCHWMERAIRMTSQQATEYHKIIHKYGQKIEREARKHHNYWDKAAEKIYKLRMDRDYKLQQILSPSQFAMYVQYVREMPTRIHDWKDWFNNPHYPNYRPSSICRHYEDHYWNHKWGTNKQPHQHQMVKPKQNRPDNRPLYGQNDKLKKDKFENKHPNRPPKKENDKGNKDRKNKNRHS